MTMRTLADGILGALLAVGLTGCAGTTAPATSTSTPAAPASAAVTTRPSSGSTSTSVPTPTAVAGPTAASTPTPTVVATTGSRSATASTTVPVAGGQATASPGVTTGTPTTAPATTPAATTRPVVQGLPGGALALGGRQYGRDDAAHTAAFLAAMGPPDATASKTCQYTTPVPVTAYRWGGLHVTVVRVQPGGDYGFSYPKGAISGWRISGDAGPGLTGPKGTRIGTPLATLRTEFTSKDWDYADLENGVFSVFAGDTTGAAWAIGPSGTVTEMSAGLQC